MLTSKDLTFGVGDYIISPHVGIHRVVSIQKQYVTPQAKQLFSKVLANLDIGDEMCPIVTYITSFTPTGQVVPDCGITLESMANVCALMTPEDIDSVIENLDNLKTIIILNTKD